MNILILGGSGSVGQGTVHLLDDDPLVTAMTIAVRNHEGAAAFASALATPSRGSAGVIRIDER